MIITVSKTKRKTKWPCVCLYISVRHEISYQTENSGDVKIAHVILVVISRLTVLISTFYCQFVVFLKEILKIHIVFSTFKILCGIFSTR
jgi:hypothetical protein